MPSTTQQRIPEARKWQTKRLELTQALEKLADARADVNRCETELEELDQELQHTHDYV